jgi:hypothetical protein
VAGCFKPELPQDPGTIFGGLLSVCVSDEYLKEKKMLAEGILCSILGLACSYATVYVLSAAGFLL